MSKDTLEAKPQKRDVTWRLWVSYDGENYCGFQSQDNGSTIQERIEAALFKLIKTTTAICVAGRTDSGVHARAQAVSCRFTSSFDSRKLVLALASQLPKDIRIWRADEMPHDFNARSHSVGKRYLYTIDTALTSDVFLGKTRWNLGRKLNVESMHQAAQLLVGEHDFESFRAAGCTAAHARRYIWHLSVCRAENLVRVEIRGNAFCYNMVRIIVGTLVHVGLAKLTPDSIMKIMAARDRRFASQTAPAHGLCFDEVYYPDSLEHAQIPPQAQFPRFPVSTMSWPFDRDRIKTGPWLS